MTQPLVPQAPQQRTHRDDVAAPGRRSVLKAAAWSVPAVSVAVAAPAFATSGARTPLVSEPLIFWRPQTSEMVTQEEKSYWPWIPENTILFGITVTNTATTASGTFQVAVDVPTAGTGTKEFEVLDNGGLSTTPAKFVRTTRPTSGRCVITVPSLAAGAAATLMVAFTAPSTMSRSTAVTWNVQVTPDGGAVQAVAVRSYTDARSLL